MRDVETTAGASNAGRSSARYYADVPNRLVALLLDAVLLTFLVFVGAVLVSVLVGPVVRFDPQGETVEEATAIQRDVAVLHAVVSLALSAVYFCAAWLLVRGTPGQRMLGLTVVGQSTGESVGVRAALVRWLLLGAPFGLGALLTTAVSSAPLAIATNATIALWYGLLVVTTAFHPAKQGLHDRIARTVVVKTARPASWNGSALHVR